MPPLTPQRWRGPRLADLPSPACPQAAPEVTITSPEALLHLPRSRISLLKRMMPLLANSSEDCLYLNLYIPRAGLYQYLLLNCHSFKSRQCYNAKLT